MRRFLLLMLLAGCADAHSSGREPRDADDPTRDAASEQTSVGDAAAGDVAIPGLLPNAEGEDSENTAPSTEPGELPALRCPVERVDLPGESPHGALRVTHLGVSYWGGFTSGTGLFARGTAASGDFEIRASVYTIRFDGRPACPVGDYVLGDDASEPSDLSVYVTHGQSLLTIRSARLHVTRHDVFGPDERLTEGSPIHFEGVLTISDPGWSLSLPFSIRTACDFWVDL